jgi:hypothetical protein
MRKDVVEYGFRPRLLSTIRLSGYRVPEGIILREPRLERIRRIVLMNKSLAAPSITRVYADGFSKQFFDFWDEGVAGG